jgi:hypothetical protein
MEMGRSFCQTLRKYSEMIHESHYPSLCCEIDNLWSSVSALKNKKNRTVTNKLSNLREEESDSCDDDVDETGMFILEGEKATIKSTYVASSYKRTSTDFKGRNNIMNK